MFFAVQVSLVVCMSRQQLQQTISRCFLRKKSKPQLGNAAFVTCPSISRSEPSIYQGHARASQVSLPPTCCFLHGDELRHQTPATDQGCNRSWLV